jgi:hypothetical protein
MSEHPFADLSAPCSTDGSVRRHPALLDQDSVGQDRDDDAMDVLVPNWDE